MVDTDNMVELVCRRNSVNETTSSGWYICPDCNGEGRRRVNEGDPYKMLGWKDCCNCNTSGKVKVVIKVWRG